MSEWAWRDCPECGDRIHLNAICDCGGDPWNIKYKIKVYKITPDYNKKTGKGLNPCVEKEIKDISIWLEEAQIGENILIEVKEMTKLEYRNLPEYGTIK